MTTPRPIPAAHCHAWLGGTGSPLCYRTAAFVVWDAEEQAWIPVCAEHRERYETAQPLGDPE